MSTISQSVVWWCYVPGKLTAEEFIRAVADIGYSAIDLVPPDYWSAILDRGLSISAVAGHQPLEIGLNRVDLHDRLETRFGPASNMQSDSASQTSSVLAGIVMGLTMRRDW